MSERAEQQMDTRETRLRSVLKAITYRITGTVTTFIITYVVTGELTAALTVGMIEPGFKLLVYYLHERAWQQVPRGTLRRWMRQHHATDS